MKFNDDAKVYAADGKKLGHLARVVMNPRTWEVTDIVVHKGYFFTTDKVIPVREIQQTLEDRVTMLETANVDAYPDFAETDFVALVGDDRVFAELPSPVLWYPPFGMLNFDPYMAHETKNIPSGTQALVIGSKVKTSDGILAGYVQEVFMESTTHISSHILVSKTLPLIGEKLVPTHWIKNIDGGEIHLAVGHKMMMSLPDYNRHVYSIH